MKAVPVRWVKGRKVWLLKIGGEGSADVVAWEDGPMIDAPQSGADAAKRVVEKRLGIVTVKKESKRK